MTPSLKDHGPERVLDAIAALESAMAQYAGTPYEVLVPNLIEALAADTTVAELWQEIEFLKAERVGGEAIACLRDLGWMPNRESPYWCFCSQAGAPDDEHTDGCVRASTLMAKVGDVGEDAEAPTPEQLIGVQDARV